MRVTRTRTRLTPFGRMVVALMAASSVLVVIRLGLGGSETTPAADQGSPATSPPPSVGSTSPPLPDCIYGDIPADHAGYDEWNRTLLDTEFRVPRTYVPTDLAPVARAGFQGDFRLRSFALPDLEKLRKAADKAGHPVDIIAAYRSFAEQARLFQSRKEQLGYDRSLDKTAREGHSEHQLGTVVDFKSAGAEDVTQGWGDEPAGRWMARNAHRFGFILSYPKGRRNVTCYPYEPWHFRYVGHDLAARIHASGLTLRQYLWRLNHG